MEFISKIFIILDNGYTVDLLKIIELIPQPFLAERTKCIYGINEWRKGLNLPPLSIDSSAESASASTPPPPPPAVADVTRGNCTATYLLQTSAKGRAIIEKYKTAKYLTRFDKRVITQIVVDGFKDRFSKLTSSELQNRAVELHSLFPSEPQETWYQPTWTTDNAGRKVRLRKLPKGTLRDRNINYKEERLAVQDASQVGAIDTERPGSSNDLTQADSTEYQCTKKWITHNQDDWEEVKIKWKQTTKIRLIELFGEEKRNTASILSEYPVLRHHQAYQLIQIDFQQRFPEKEKLLFDRWETFVGKVLPVLEAEVTDTAGKALLSCLKDDDISDDGRGLITIWLLHHIMPSPILRTPGKPRWKPSFVESRESVAILVKDLSELQTTLAKILKTTRERGVELAPFIVAHGEDPKNPSAFSVWNNVTSYKLPSFQKALDVCLKIYKSYGIAFPRQSLSVWHLLANLMFDFEVPREQINVVALCSSLRTSVQQPKQES
ncbi:uncharacterized protein LOC109398652 isoform X3 [Aedes albopictus]|uniref:Uncharacterized protein n=1 Tax=Aedes albopictus TaxID=7160 RepID=A0ABM1XTU0_AEDAL